MPPTFVKQTVSPVHFESAPTLPEDILCPGSEEEDNSDEHRQKRRRRIEELGTQYLEGGGLFIQSASLRGPFDEGWKNPWANLSVRHTARDVRRFPEARQVKVERTTEFNEGRQELATRKGGSTISLREGNIHLNPTDEVDRGQRTVGYPEPAAKRRKYEVSLDQKLDTSLAHAFPDNGGWLKRQSDARSTRPENLGRNISPSPAARDRPIATSPKSRRWQSPVGSSPRRRAERNRAHKPAAGQKEQGFTPINGRPTSAEQQTTPQQSKQHEDQRPSLPQQPPKRLEPYVSVIAEQSTSGKFAARHTTRSPRPSPHVVPPSTYLPEFNYRYARKESASTSDRSNAPFVDAPEEITKRGRSSSSSSSSSSGSSAFAEALTAAQAKADSAARGSSPSSTPRIEAEIRRLSFTASGKPRVTTSRSSSGPGPSFIDPALLNGGDGKRSNPTSFSKQSSKASDKPTSLSKQSSRLSDKRMTNGDHSREILPEAQIVPDAPIPPVTSGPSTNLLETEKQSPKFPSIDEGDSYMNLSTQAAILKAQRSFQNDILGAWNESAEKARSKSAQLSAMLGGDATTTPITNGLRRHTKNNSQPVKTEPLAEEAMSTQAMINEMSPFAITTIKKRPPASSLKKRASFALSPIEKRKPHQPKPSSLPSPTSPGSPPTARSYHDRSMSTSSSDGSRPAPPSQRSRAALSRQHSAAKPPSSVLTSFSILPNVNSTETQMGQDGQVIPQLAQPPPPTFPEPDWGGDTSLSLNPFDSLSKGNPAAATTAMIGGAERGNELNNSWWDKENDLKAAIEEAGSFLGGWDVEAEARREGKIRR